MPGVLPSRAKADTPSSEKSQVQLRGLNPEDRDQHLSHLLRLTPEDRRARFHAAVSDEAVARYVANFDWDHALVFGIFVDDTLRGVGELLHGGEGGEEAEISISIETDYRHAGYGKLLVLAMFLAARRLGVRHLNMYYLSDNHGMRALARDVGATQRGFSDVIFSSREIPA